MSHECYSVGDLYIDVGSASVWRDGQEIPLAPLSYELLLALTRHAPDVVSTDRLIDEVWNGIAVSNETLTQRVALLRRSLGEDGQRPVYLRSVRGRGYRLMAAVERTDRFETARLVPPPRRRFRNRWALGQVAAASAATVLTLLSLFLASSRSDSSFSPAPRVSSADLVSRGNVYLGRHRVEDNRLAIEIYRSALDRDPEHPSALVGLSLGLSQNVTKFNGSTEISKEALSLAERALRLSPDDAEAHRARALALDSRGWVSEALAGYRRAADLDPSCGRALSSAAYLHYIRGELAEALHLNLRASELPDERPYGELQIGSTLVALGFEREGEIWLERAVELRPDNVFAAATLAKLRLIQGRLEAARSIAREALAAGIRRPELRMALGHASLLEGDREAAARGYREALAMSSRFGYARTRLLILERWTDDSPELVQRYRTAVAEIRRWRAEGDQWPESAIDEALLHAAFDRPQEAVEALAIAIDLGYRDSGWLLLDPMLSSLADEPGFQACIREIAEAVAAERSRALQASWLPPQLLVAGEAAG